MVNTNGPVALLGINRDSLSRSHRSVRKNVRNTRDILKVGEVNDKFDKYESPAQKPVRITSAMSKRSITALRDSQAVRLHTTAATIDQDATHTSAALQD